MRLSLLNFHRHCSEQNRVPAFLFAALRPPPLRNGVLHCSHAENLVPPAIDCIAWIMIALHRFGGLTAKLISGPFETR